VKVKCAKRNEEARRGEEKFCNYSRANLTVRNMTRGGRLRGSTGSYSCSFFGYGVNILMLGAFGFIGSSVLEIDKSMVLRCMLEVYYA
jgi:hypothetical protein